MALSCSTSTSIPFRLHVEMAKNEKYVSIMPACSRREFHAHPISIPASIPTEIYLVIDTIVYRAILIKHMFVINHLKINLIKIHIDTRKVRFQCETRVSHWQASPFISTLRKRERNSSILTGCLIRHAHFHVILLKSNSKVRVCAGVRRSTWEYLISASEEYSAVEVHR